MKRGESPAPGFTHKGYTGVATFDEDAGVFHGEVIGTRDVITFQAASAEELRRAFRASVEDYLAFCAARGESPDLLAQNHRPT